MRLFLTTILVFSALSVQAQRFGFQFPSEMWHSGEVVLSDGNTVRGIIKYDISGDVIQVDQDKKIQTFAASQIQQFKIFQEDIARFRLFFSIPFLNKNGYRRPSFFELIFEGETSLLAREMILVTTRPPRDPYFSGGRRYNPYGLTSNVRVLDHELYLMNNKGKITQLTKKRKDVIYSFDDKYSDLKKIIKSNRLKMNSIDDIATLVAEYNKLGDQ
ncbi:hypothetical protein [Roseivirga sp. E12]|uniref:hypothetical protein n=1 Tax=Roseivirga sp. E12 TaxID=2819237 RepID=UPI001ABC7FB5|nr:hypothetical protein [Roseivirga sp. E12]MBO3697874.1 hypothetical protein [Roseivirga sp. E12]